MSDDMIAAFQQELEISFQKICAIEHIDAESFRFATDVWQRFYADEVVARLIRYVTMFEGDETVSVKYPDGWWQAVRERFAPRWVLRRWPVKYIVKEWHAAEILPNLPMPDDWRKGSFKVMLPGAKHG